MSAPAPTTPHGHERTGANHPQSPEPPRSLATASADYSIYAAFYGFDIMCVAYLVFRSGFLPRAIGAALAVDGLACLVNSFTGILAPGVAAQLAPWIDLPAPIGEGSFCLWLLIAGVDPRRWSRHVPR